MPRKNASPAILEAAKTCLMEGDGDFEMSDVAKKAKVSEGLAYHYYTSKAGLLAAVITDFYKRYMAIVNRRHDGDTPWLQRERTRLNEIVDFLYSDPLAPIVMGKLNGTPQATAVELVGNAEVMELAVRNIQNGIEQGYIDPRINAHVSGPAIMGAVQQAFLYAMGAKDRPCAQILKDQLWGLITGALGISATGQHKTTRK